MARRSTEASLRVRAETFQGVPCKHGHDGLRYASNGSCVPCVRRSAVPKTEEARIRKLAYKRDWELGKHATDPAYRARRTLQQRDLSRARRAALKADPVAHAAFREQQWQRRHGAVREIKVEEHLVKRVRQLGGFCPKFVDPGRRGAPDRIVILPDGRLYFVELKRPKGGHVESWQLRYHARLGRVGHTVLVLRSIETVDAWLDSL